MRQGIQLGSLHRLLSSLSTWIVIIIYFYDDDDHDHDEEDEDDDDDDDDDERNLFETSTRILPARRWAGRV